VLRISVGTFLLAACLAGLASSSGCYSYKAFSPSELPKLNNTYTTLIGVVRTNNGSQTLYNNSYKHLKTPNGRILAVEGRPSEVRLKLASGRVLLIATPYQFEPHGDRLKILTATGPPITVAYEDITRAEVWVPDLHFPKLRGQGVAITVTVIACLAVGLSVLVMFLAADESNSAYKNVSGTSVDPFPPLVPGWRF